MMIGVDHGFQTLIKVERGIRMIAQTWGSLMSEGGLTNNSVISMKSYDIQ